MELQLILSLVLAVFATYTAADHVRMGQQIQPIANSMWDDFFPPYLQGTVANRTTLVLFFRRYERQSPITYMVEVWEQDFTGGGTTWQGDFAIFGVTAEQARAYFRCIDVATQERLMINERDIDSILFWLDENGDGAVNETEWKTYFAPAFLRPVPWTLMFVRYDAVPDELIDEIEFITLFDVWDTDGDSSVTLLEFTTFWELGDYGDATTAQDAHNALDFNQDGVIDSVDDINQLYTNIDTDNNRLLDIDEWHDIDVITYGLPFPPPLARKSRRPNHA